MHDARKARSLMVAPEVQGIDLFKIANRSISGWVPSFKMGSAVAPVNDGGPGEKGKQTGMWSEGNDGCHHFD